MNQGIKLLLQLGADVEAYSYRRGWTILHGDTVGSDLLFVSAMNRYVDSN